MRCTFASRSAVAATLAIALGSLAVTDPTAAQDRASERVVSVSASGSVSAVPDIAHVSTGVVTEAETARDALSKNTAAMRALIDGLKSLSIDGKDIRTSQINVEPRYQQFKDGRPPVINGYRVVNQVGITQRDVARLGEVLDKVVSLGANQFGGIRFEVSRAEALKDEARKQAMENAVRRAQLYATAAGAAVGQVLTISENLMVSGPRPVTFARAAMAESVPVEPGAQSLEVTVHVSWALK